MPVLIGLDGKERTFTPPTPKLPIPLVKGDGSVGKVRKPIEGKFPAAVVKPVLDVAVTNPTADAISVPGPDGKSRIATAFSWPITLLPIAKGDFCLYGAPDDVSISGRPTKRVGSECLFEVTSSSGGSNTVSYDARPLIGRGLAVKGLSEIGLAISIADGLSAASLPSKTIALETLAGKVPSEPMFVLCPGTSASKNPRLAGACEYWDGSKWVSKGFFDCYIRSNASTQPVFRWDIFRNAEGPFIVMFLNGSHSTINYCLSKGEIPQPI